MAGHGGTEPGMVCGTVAFKANGPEESVVRLGNGGKLLGQSKDECQAMEDITKDQKRGKESLPARLQTK